MNLPPRIDRLLKGGLASALDHDLVNKIMNVAFWACVLSITSQVLGDYGKGGHPWKQADWLISAEGGLVRRGLFGSALLRLSDALHVSPLIAVIATQTLLFLTLAGTLFAILKRAKLPDIYWLLILSPGFFLLFWAHDPQGALRKELLAYVALFLLLLSLIEERKLSLIVLSSLVFVVAMIGHEANILFLPCFLACLYIAFADGQIARGRFWFVAIALVVSAVLAAALAAGHAAVQDSTILCRPLLERGLDPQICRGGALKSLEQNVFATIPYLYGRAFQVASLGSIVSYAMILGLFGFFAGHFAWPVRFPLLMLLTAVPILPLYIVGGDWGRWIDFHLTSLTCVVLALALTGRLRQTREIDGRVLVLAIALPPMLTPSHILGWRFSPFSLFVTIGLLAALAYSQARVRFRAAG